MAAEGAEGAPPADTPAEQPARETSPEEAAVEDERATVAGETVTKEAAVEAAAGPDSASQDVDMLPAVEEEPAERGLSGRLSEEPEVRSVTLGYNVEGF